MAPYLFYLCVEYCMLPDSNYLFFDRKVDRTYWGKASYMYLCICQRALIPRFISNFYSLATNKKWLAVWRKVGWQRWWWCHCVSDGGLFVCWFFSVYGLLQCGLLTGEMKFLPYSTVGAAPLDYDSWGKHIAFSLIKATESSLGWILFSSFSSEPDI